MNAPGHVSNQRCGRGRRIAMVQALPLEYYPPVTNLLDHLATIGGFEVEVHTVRNAVGRKDYFNPGCTIYRSSAPGGVGRAFSRLWRHLRFTLGTVWRLLRFRPDAILYYEPHSAMPVYLYSHYVQPAVAVFIHNHEYYAPANFARPGMRMVQLFHKREVAYLYRKAVWISQTNADRLALFRRDYPFIDPSVTQVLPNYPPQAWLADVAAQPKPARPPLRCVHVGAVSLEDSYVREICAWVARQQGAVTLDFYDYKIPARTRQYLAEVDVRFIRCFDEGVLYGELPRLLAAYHVGLVLHRGNTVNYIYNAPNKLFEYLACGLDVWCPADMLGVVPYLRSVGSPKVVAVDFTRLDAFDAAAAVSDDAARVCCSTYTCEQALSGLVAALRGEAR
jgi:hypothetical protein